MCDPRQGSTLTGQPRGTICRVTCTLRRYLPACQPTSLPAYLPSTQAGTRPSSTTCARAFTLTLKHTHSLTHTRTRTRTLHTTGTEAYPPPPPGRTAQAGRRTWLRHIFPRRNGLFIKWNKAERARLAPGTSTPPSRSCPSPPLRGQIRSIARLSSSLMARSPSVARSLVHCTWPRWPRRPSLMLQPAASSGPPRYHFPRLFPVGNTQAEWMPRPKSHPNLGNSAPFLQSKRLNIQLTTSDAPFHMRTLLALILHLLYESHLSSTGPRTITSSSWPRS